VIGRPTSPTSGGDACPRWIAVMKYNRAARPHAMYSHLQPEVS
jgi:hypothetical protein